jgi:hypothetical protein
MIARASQYWELWQEYLKAKIPNSMEESWEQEFRGWEPTNPETLPSGRAVAELLAWYEKRSVATSD